MTLEVDVVGKPEGQPDLGGEELGGLPVEG